MKNSLKALMFLFTLLYFIPMMCAGGNGPIKLYPDGTKTDNHLKGPEVFDGFCIGNVSEASIRVFKPLKNNSGACVIICPGGGYTKEAYIHEGYQYAEWLAKIGITSVVLKYRLPNGNPEIPLMDVKEALKYMHTHANQYGIDTTKIGVSGFSAGGHLAACAGTLILDNYKPSFMVLFYPVISMEDRLTHKGSQLNFLGSKRTIEQEKYYSLENQITKDTPKTFMVLSNDDKSVNPQNSLNFYTTLLKNGVKSSIYVFPSGGHGWGFYDTFKYHETWKDLLFNWFQEMDILSIRP